MVVSNFRVYYFHSIFSSTFYRRILVNFFSFTFFLQLPYWAFCPVFFVEFFRSIIIQGFRPVALLVSRSFRSLQGVLLFRLPFIVKFFGSFFSFTFFLQLPHCALFVQYFSFSFFRSFLVSRSFSVIFLSLSFSISLFVKFCVQVFLSFNGIRSLKISHIRLQLFSYFFNELLNVFKIL